MKLGLHTRMFLASVAVVLLTLVLAGAFVGDTVRGNFSRYAHAEANEQAYDLALYLEAWLNRSGNQETPGVALERFFAGQVDDFAPYEPNDEEGPLWGDWTQMAADDLGLSLESLSTFLRDQSLEDLYWNQNADPESLLANIMRSEMKTLAQQGISEADSVDELAGILAEAHVFLYEEPEYREDSIEENNSTNFIPERLSWFLDTLVDDALILATNPDGLVLFDSQGGLLGTPVSEEFFDSAVEVYDWRDGSEMCQIIVAAGPGYYRKEANFFLSEVQQSLQWSALALLIAALLLSWWFSRRFLQPVQALTEATTRLVQGDWQGRLPVDRDDEVGRMSTSFNHMLDSLEEQQALRKRLIADLAHELNTPLSVIQLELAGLEAGMQSTHECADRIGMEVEVLKRLSEDVRLLSDSDRGALQLNPAPCDMVACCEEAVKRWQARASEKQIQLKYIGANSLPELQADQLRIMQVLGNLLNNAVRHCNMHGNIQIDARVHHVSGGESAIHVSIKDDGEGIPANQLQAIFERFTRADSDRNRDIAGRGLGLAIVTDLVKGHGGRVWVESEVGAGSIFSFLLPL